jgi:hypothetical protein
MCSINGSITDFKRAAMLASTGRFEGAGGRAAAVVCARLDVGTPIMTASIVSSAARVFVPFVMLTGGAISAPRTGP